MKKLFIVGSGGFGREVLWLAQRVNEKNVRYGRDPEWEIIGFIDDNQSLHGTTQDDYPVLGGCDYLGRLNESVYTVIAIGSARVKKLVAEKLSVYPNVHFATLIDPSAIISDRVDSIKLEKEKFTGDLFRYDCPFLINDECAVYEYRGIVCRTFGLMENAENNVIKAPFCCYQGLNYSNVMENNDISEEKVKNLNLEVEPLAFNINHDILTNTDFERGFNIKFGEKKPLIDWLEGK